MKKISAVLLCVVVLAIPTYIFSSEYKIYGMVIRPQQKITYCGAAVAQMWIEYLTGWVVRQSRLAPMRPGMSAHRMKYMLKNYTGKGFSVNDHWNEKSARKRIYKELHEQRRPLAIAGTTVRKNYSSFRPLGHWLLIHSADIASKRKGYKVKFVKLIDPLFASRWENNYEVVTPHRKLDAGQLFGIHWHSRSDGYRTSVDD